MKQINNNIKTIDFIIEKPNQLEILTSDEEQTPTP